MSDYTGPGIYGIVPYHAPDMSLDVWGDAKKEGTPVKLYKRNPKAKNHQFMIVDAGGHDARTEKGDREYLIIAVNSGLYLTCNGEGKQVTTELRSPFDSNVRWKLAHAGNGAFYINHCIGDKQLNVSQGSKESGADLICYKPSTASNAQFMFKSVY